MKTILVPTDFSPAAENALNFAVEMNKKLHYDILLFHAYEVPMPVTDVPIMPPDEEFRDNALNSLNQISNKYKVQYPDMKFTVEAVMGNSNNEIVNMEKKSKCSMVVMGSYGEDTMHHLIAGRHVSPVISKSACPVVVVPRNATFKQLNKIVFAVNFGTDDLANSMQVADMAKTFGSEMIILHVITKEHGKRRQHAEIEKFKESVVEQSGYGNITYKIMEHDDVFDGINAYIEEINASMIVISMRQRSFMDKIFSRSLSKKIAYHSNKPLMVLHTAME